MKQIFMMAMAAAVAVGCSKQDSMDTVQEPGTIRLFMGVEAPASKAAVTPELGATGVQFLKKDGVAGTAPDDFSGFSDPAVEGASILPLAGSIAATLGEVTFTGGAYSYNMNDNHAWMVAYHPKSTLADNAVTWAVDGKTDIMRTDLVWDAGKYSAPLTGATGTKMILNHCLSRVEVKCEAESGSSLAAVQAAWGNIEKIEFLNAPTKVVYTLSPVLAIANGSELANFSLLKNYDGVAFESIAMPKNASTDVNAVAMLAPVSATETESFKLKVTTAGAGGGTPVSIVKEIDVKLTNATNPTSMEKGKIHLVTLTFKADGKDIEIKNTTIEAWTDGPAVSVEMNK